MMTFKEMRKEYRIKPKIGFEIDKQNYLFFLIPTVIWQPWKYRYKDSYVVCLHWLNFAVGFGLWINEDDSIRKYREEHSNDKGTT